MKVLLWKVRLSVLWVVLAVGMSAHTLLALVEPGTVAELVEGHIEREEVTTALMVMATFFWVVPLMMAFLCFVLRDPVNRLANAGVGFIVTGMWAWDLIASVSEGFNGFTLVLVGIVAAGTAILWHAWRWPEAQDEHPPAEEVTLTPSRT